MVLATSRRGGLFLRTNHYPSVVSAAVLPNRKSRRGQNRDLGSKVEPGRMEARGNGKLEEKKSVASTAISEASDLSSVSTTSSTVKTKRSLARKIQQATGDFFSALGFITSSATALVFDRTQFKRLKPTVLALRNFLSTSGIDLELSPSLNSRLPDHLAILGRIQKALLQDRDRRDLALSTKNYVNLPTEEEALRYAVCSPFVILTHGRNFFLLTYLTCLLLGRYMKYATAAYGNSMIRAAEMDVAGRYDNRVGLMTRSRISEHIGVPEEDIASLDVDYDGDGNHLRHFVAVDHINRKVVLAIRGTFSLSEVIVDVASFSREFCGGEAHSEMASMAERVWKASGETVLKLLRQNAGYELVLTGHSLGAGSACLLNILLHRNGRQLVEGRAVRCFAYASPPVFTPLEFAHKAVRACTNFIHDNDAVPFLSVDSVRHLFASVRVLEKRHMKWLERTRLFTGYLAPDSSLCSEVEQESRKRLVTKKGAPLLEIPAAANLWLRKDEEKDTYNWKVCDSGKLATLGIQIDGNMLQDHFPSRYENALHNLE